jgi:YggT family protein
VTVKSILCDLIYVYIIVLIGRAIMSWFPIRPGTIAATIYGVLHDVTEPVLAPLRRVIPPAGMFDLSFIVLFILLEILHSVICR